MIYGVIMFTSISESVIYNKASVYQLRNKHDIVLDLENEIIDIEIL